MCFASFPGRGHFRTIWEESTARPFLWLQILLFATVAMWFPPYPWPVHVFTPTGIWKWDAQCLTGDVRMFVATDIVWPPGTSTGHCPWISGGPVISGGCTFFRSKLLLLIHSWCFSCVHVLMNCFCPLGLHEIWSLERRWQRAEGRAKSLGISFGAKAWSSWSWVFDGTSSPNQCFFLDGPPWKEHPPRHTLQMPCYWLPWKTLTWNRGKPSSRLSGSSKSSVGLAGVVCRWQWLVHFSRW